MSIAAHDGSGVGALKFRSTDVQTWGINFHRNVRRRNEDGFWSPLPRIYDISRVSLAGTLESLEGIEPGANIRVKPYFVNSLGRTATTDSDYDADWGLDIKYGLTSAFTWDFTYNPDFSQVEADDQQIEQAHVLMNDDAIEDVLNDERRDDAEHLNDECRKK